MKISFTGAQSTGKTTLLNAMKSMSIFRDFVFRDEITRSIQKQGLKINEQGDDATQNKIIDSHLLNLKTVLWIGVYWMELFIQTISLIRGKLKKIQKSGLI